MGVSWREEIAERQKNWRMVDRFKANSPNPGVRDEEDWSRERLKGQHAFFSAKRKHFPSPAQLKLWREVKGA